MCYPRRRRGLAVDLFRHERLVLVCHPLHPLAARRMVTVPDLQGHRFVAWTEIRSSPFLRDIPKNLRHHFAPRHECDQVEGVKGLVELDAGVAILPEALVRSEVAGHRLAAVPFADGGRTSRWPSFTGTREADTPHGKLHPMLEAAGSRGKSLRLREQEKVGQPG